MSAITPRAPRTPKARRPSPASRHVGELLGRYTDPRGRERELVCRPGTGGSALVIDRLTGTLVDQRLVAHLAADEPAENARIVGSQYLADVHGRRCRRLTAEDLDTAPFVAGELRAASAAKDLIEARGGELIDECGWVYRLQEGRSGTSIPELRWQRHPPGGEPGCWQVVTVRAVIGSLESYEPARAITSQALVSPNHDGAVSVAALRAELDRVHASRIVLNRGLRQAVLAAVHGARPHHE